MDAGSIKILCCILLICASAFCSSAESAYARANKIKLKNIAESGSKKGKRALHIANNFDRALVTILIGNNIVNLSCASLATLAVIDIWGEGHEMLSTIVTTVVVFLFGEILPKSCANANSEKIALAYAGPLSTMIKLFTPIAFIFVKVSNLIAKLCGGEQDERMTEEELETIIDTVEESGTLDEEQTDLLQNAVDFTKTPVENVMTMREDICGVDINDAPDKILETVKSTGFSRLPVFNGDIDHVIGVLSVREYLRTYVRRGNVNLRRVMMPPKFAAPDAAIDDLFREMSAGKQQFLIVREGATTVGVATVEDFLEELVGEIWDEYDEYDENFIKLGGNYFEISPKMKVRDAFARIGYEATLPADIQKKTLEAWLRGNIEDGELEKDKGFAFGNLAVMAGEMEDGSTLSGVIIRLCESEEEAKEELEK
ncbi:MAG: HlyC/CorC family transporter [Clostridia bacterium]|nr:HlyC/CorC family transporter [Clostridia bacterium]